MESEKSLVKALDMPVRVNEFGADGTMHVHCWFNYMQHIASAHAEELGFGMRALSEKGLIWVLSRIRLHIERSPSTDDVIRIETYPNGVDRLFAKRQFKLSSMTSGCTLGFASSYWLALDAGTQRIKSPADVGVERNMNSCLPDYFPVMDKIGAGKALNAEMRTVRHSCIDMNRHMNNACYCQFGMDWLAEQGVAEKSVREVQLNFNHALKAGEMCSVCGELKENAFIVAGQSQEANKNAFMMDGILNGNSR